MGIDEAGVGEVVGSLYVGYAVTEEPEKLESLNLTDSKNMNLNSLEEKFSDLSSFVETGVVTMSPAELEEMLEEDMTLPKMEDYAIASLVGSKPPDVLQVDCYYPTTSMLEVRLRDLMQGQAADVDIRISHSAEERWPLVAAAGIVAKIHQVREYTRLRRLHGDVFGSGNGSDARTRSFIEENGDDPYFVRTNNVSDN